MAQRVYLFTESSLQGNPLLANAAATLTSALPQATGGVASAASSSVPSLLGQQSLLLDPTISLAQGSNEQQQHVEPHGFQYEVKGGMLTKLRNLEREISRLTHDATIPDDQKLMLVGQLQDKLQNYQSQFRSGAPLSSSAIATPVTAPSGSKAPPAKPTPPPPPSPPPVLGTKPKSKKTKN